MQTSTLLSHIYITLSILGVLSSASWNTSQFTTEVFTKLHWAFYFCFSTGSYWEFFYIPFSAENNSSKGSPNLVSYIYFMSYCSWFISPQAYELSTLTGTQVLLLVASETGHVYTFATRKLQPMITSETGKALIQTCLNSPDSPPRSDPSMDQRMSATGFEETDLTYQVSESESMGDTKVKTHNSNASDSVHASLSVLFERLIKQLKHYREWLMNIVRNISKTCRHARGHKSSWLPAVEDKS